MVSHTSPLSSAPTTWEPYDGFFNAAPATRRPFALLILNQEITHKERFSALWRNAVVRVCADGGSNRVFDLCTSGSTDEAENFIPDAIIGDLDSARIDVLKFYSERNVKIIRDPDQDSTDFGKAMNLITGLPECTREEAAAQAKIPVVALGGLGGRVDQSFHSIHALYLAQQDPDVNRQVLLVSSENVTFLLKPGLNRIHTPLERLGPCCGIIPVGGPATITTSGFEWDLEDADTRFGGLVSTSNHVTKDVVEVETTSPIVFTVEFRDTGRMG